MTEQSLCNEFSESNKNILDLDTKVMNMFISEIASKYKIDKKDLKSRYESIKMSVFSKCESNTLTEESESHCLKELKSGENIVASNNSGADSRCIALKKNGERCTKNHVSSVHSLCSVHAKMAMKANANDESSEPHPPSVNSPVNENVECVPKDETSIVDVNDDKCTSIKKDGSRCKNKSKSGGLCGLHSKKPTSCTTVSEDITKKEDQAKSDDKLRLTTNIYLGLKWDPKNRFVMLTEKSEDGTNIYKIIGVFTTKLEHLNSDNIIKIREVYDDKYSICLHENHSEIDFKSLSPQFPLKMKEEFDGQISPEYVS